MTPQQILIVAVRLFAIFWLLTSIGHLVTAVRLWNSYSPDAYGALGLLVPILELAACAFLWFFPATLSRRLLKADAARSDAPAPALLEWQAMLLVTLGPYTLAFAIPDVVYWITYFMVATKTDVGFSGDLADQWPSVLSTVAQLAIGVWLLLGAPRLSALLLRLRALGLREG